MWVDGIALDRAESGMGPDKRMVLLWALCVDIVEVILVRWC